nr:immunoglobulin light chain junction region [Macaca mulatta]MOX24557.1 immunoglobulin light chain junction region [Macaca mulatta]MOX24836.1 immunoglobulin light chain junction region [Macaca mulatta]MOX24889.1 immunoglobulin light chain junction region [Macaca mulatta]MOX25161.1 immunoglobulin light chain junction region [Macaca mulatta]
CQQHSSYPRTF